ncbi:hypothetical protein, partial [Staphylococcus pasteuri_A]
MVVNTASGKINITEWFKRSNKLAYHAFPLVGDSMTYSLYLAHINDTHSHFESSLVHFHINLHGQRYQIDAQCGGYARIASAVAEQRKIAKQQQVPSILLHAGDS